jgi:hypothetical protein
MRDLHAKFFFLFIHRIARVVAFAGEMIPSIGWDKMDMIVRRME